MVKNVVAMILAGGKGTRLQSLTKKVAKPAVGFAGKYRIIDFPLSNCANSGINSVGVLTQYESTALDRYIGNGEKWGLNGVRCVMTSLAPRQTEEGASWYNGTADAIAQNIEFIDERNPDCVLILSGDHIYKTTYNDMISLHVNSKADATISVIDVNIKEASRFGIMNCDKSDRIISFEEKPKEPKSTLASMGVYVFEWATLRKYLIADMKNPDSDHDFGKNIIPTMLADNKKLMAYRFSGYWRDVGTVASLHQANMDVALDKCSLNLFDNDLRTRIYTEDVFSVPSFIGKYASVKKSVVNQGARIHGSIDTCVVSTGAVVEKGAVCDHTVIMQGALVKSGAIVHNAILAPNSVVKEKEKVNVDSESIVLVA